MWKQVNICGIYVITVYHLHSKEKLDILLDEKTADGHGGCWIGGVRRPERFAR